MADEPIRIPFPLRGVHRGTAVVDQPELSTPNALNVRSLHTGDRRGGGRRGGLVKQFTGAAGDTKIPGLARILALRLLRLSTGSEADEGEFGPGPFPINWENIFQGLDDDVYEMKAFGGNNILHIMGAFTVAGAFLDADYYARLNTTTLAWDRDPNQWDIVPNSPMGSVVFDDGDGEQLYAAGAGLNYRFARWSRASSDWEDLSGAIGGGSSAIHVVAEYDGSLYVGGDFTTIGGTSISNIARWNGSVGGFSPLGSGTDDAVYALASFADELYVGGRFVNVDGSNRQYLAKWNGSDWSLLGPEGVPFTVTSGELRVASLLADEIGATGETRLYIGGTFDGEPHSFISSWDGSAFVPLVSGLRVSEDDVYKGVRDMVVFNDSQVTKGLWVAGQFRQASVALVNPGLSVPNIARWDGETWASVNVGVGQEQEYINDIEVAGGTGLSHLFVGGHFVKREGIHTNGLAIYDANGMRAFPGAGLVPLNPTAIQENVAAGGGPGEGIPWRMSLAATGVLNNTGFQDLFVGGTFANADALGQTFGFTSSAPNLVKSAIARWDGDGWNDMSGGLWKTSPDTIELAVQSLHIYNNGINPPLLLVGGNFDRVSSPTGQVNANFVAWTGSAWQQAAASGTPDGPVYAMAESAIEFDGVIRAIVVGEFDTVGTGPITNANNVVGYSGPTQIYSRGMGIEGLRLGGVEGDALGMTVVAYSDWMVVGGKFDSADSFIGLDVPSAAVAWWNGTIWVSKGNGVAKDEDLTQTYVWASAVYDNEVYIAGDFNETYDSGVGPHTALPGGIAKYDVATDKWVPVGAGVSGGEIHVLYTWDDGVETKLYAGGDFTSVNGVGTPALGIATWNGSTWAALSSDDTPGFWSLDGNMKVHAITAWEGQLVIGGQFNGFGGSDASYIARGI